MSNPPYKVWRVEEARVRTRAIGFISSAKCLEEQHVYKPFDLSGKVALVTGGNGGIGLGMAEALAAAGADVVIWGTNETKNAAAEKTLKAHGKRVAVRKVDVSKENEVVDGMKAALADMGRIDFVVANAGIGGGAPITELTTELFRKVNGVNNEGVF